MPMKKRPRSEMTTVPPAIRALRPAVLTASETAARGSQPPASDALKRVRMSRA
jgi:hypothetical protein